MKGNSLVVVFKFGLHGLGLIDVRFGFSVIELAIPRVRPGLVAYGAAPVKPIARRSLQTDWGLPRLRKRMPSKRSPDGAACSPKLFCQRRSEIRGLPCGQTLHVLRIFQPPQPLLQRVASVARMERSAIRGLPYRQTSF